MNREEIEKWRLAGEISGRVLREVSNKVKKGVKLLKLCEEGEELIRKLGGKPAFPVNISINEIAAHYTSPPLDSKVVGDNSFVKVDLGAHVNGYIGDTAVTVYVGKNNKLASDIMKAAKSALQSAIDIAKDGVRVGELSSAIYKTAHDAGYGVLLDLNGHEIKRYMLHSGLTIPNSPKIFEFMGFQRGPKLKEGMVIAIEPFLIMDKKDSETTPNTPMTYIYSLIPNKKSKEELYRKLYRAYRSLPFALRWLVKSRVHIRRVVDLLYRLEKKKLLHSYPTLVERNGRIVVQFEHTILIKKSSAEILTLPT
ncbi:MAG: type II methionyl aminopeptidase [Candidatus Njordarchaeia archaeon]